MRSSCSSLSQLLWKRASSYDDCSVVFPCSENLTIWWNDLLETPLTTPSPFPSRILSPYLVKLMLIGVVHVQQTGPITAHPKSTLMAYGCSFWRHTTLLMYKPFWHVIIIFAGKNLDIPRMGPLTQMQVLLMYLVHIIRSHRQHFRHPCL